VGFSTHELLHICSFVPEYLPLLLGIVMITDEIIFIHIPKTAGTYTCACLAKAAIPFVVNKAIEFSPFLSDRRKGFLYLNAFKFFNAKSGFSNIY